MRASWGRPTRGHANVHANLHATLHEYIVVRRSTTRGSCLGTPCQGRSGEDVRLFYSMVELLMTCSVSSCIEMLGSTFQPPPELSRMVESSITSVPS